MLGSQKIIKNQNYHLKFKQNFQKPTFDQKMKKVLIEKGYNILKIYSLPIMKAFQVS